MRSLKIVRHFFLLWGCSIAFSTVVHASPATVKVAWVLPKSPTTATNGKLSLSVNGKVHFLTKDGVSIYQQLLPAEFEDYKIPAGAILAAFSWHAGYGDVLYVLKKGSQLEVYRREMDGSETSRFPARKIASIPLT